MIVDRHIWKQVVAPSITALLILVIIFLCYTLVAILNNDISGALGQASVFTLFNLISLNLLIAAPTLLPAAFYLGIVFSITRLYQDSEIPVLFSLGWSEWRLARPIILSALVLVVISFVLTLWVRPWAYIQIYKAEETLLQHVEFSPTASGVFLSLGNGDWILNTEKVNVIDNNTRELSGIFLYIDHPKQPKIITAKRATVSLSPNEHSNIKLYSGAIYWLKENGQVYREGAFDRLNFNTQALHKEFGFNKRKTLSTATLMSQINSPKETGELQSRFNLPIITFLLCLMAIPFSRLKPRQGPNSRIFLALMLYILALYFMSTVQNSLEQGILPSMPGLWMISIAGFLVVIFIYVQPILSRPARN